MAHLSDRAWSFAPRSFARYPKLFGKTHAPLEMVYVAASELAKVDAAQLQHVAAYQIRSALLGRPFTAAIAETGLNYDRAMRVQRGEIQMQISDLMYWVARYPAVRAAAARYLSALIEPGQLSPMEAPEGSFDSFVASLG